MNTLTIPQIFANLDYYKANYLSIISNPEQYHTPVGGAYINVWPLARQDLFLGDLLQLWFSEKWLVNEGCRLRVEHPDDGRKFPLKCENDLYLFQLAGSALSGSNRCKVWSISEEKVLSVELNSALKYYCFHKGSQRDLCLNQNQLIKVLKKAG